MSNRGDLLRVRARFRETQAEQETRLNRFLALMGDGAGNVAVAGRPLFVYVRVQGRGVVECLNQIAALRNDLPLIVGYDFKKPDTLQVLSIYEGGMTSFGPYAYLPAHHQAHEFQNASGGDDVVWIQKQAVLPLLCTPTSPISMFVEVLEDNYPWLSGWNLFPATTSADLTARIPALPGDARFVLIYVDGATNILGYSNGAIFPAAWPPGTAFSLTPAPPAGSVPVASIYLPNGITAIDWANIYDVRLFNQPIGGSVTPGPHALLDNAVHSDTVTNTPPAQGSIIVADGTPEWDELVHPGGAGYALTTDATDVIWDQTPAWTGVHTFNAGLVIGAAQGITLPDPGWIGFGPAAERLTMATGVPDIAEFVGFGQLNIENVLGHIGDADTYLIFAPDSIVLRAGGVDLVHATTVGADRVEINPNEDDVDFIVNSNGLADTLLVDGATGAISVTGPSLTVPATWNLIVPDNVADAFGIDDAGGIEYLKIITTDAQPIIRFNDGGVDVDFEVEAVGVADALQVQGSDGQITLGVLTAGFVKSSAAGVLSVALEVALAELAGYVRGSIIRGGAADWEALAHPGAAGHALVSTALDVVWSATPAWTNTHSFAAGIDFVGVSGANNLTVNDNIAIALELLDAGGLEYMRIVSTDANPYFLIDPAGAGIRVGVGTAAPVAPVEIYAPVAVAGLSQLQITDGATGGYFAITEGATGAGIYLPQFYMLSAGIDSFGGVIAGVMPVARDVLNVARAAIILEGSRVTPAVLQNANILQVTNFGAALVTVTRGGEVGILTQPREALDVTGSAIVGAHDGSDIFYVERFSAGSPDAQIYAGYADNDVPVGFMFAVRGAAGAAANAVNFKSTGVVQFIIGYGGPADVQTDAVGNLIIVSDERLKTDVEPLDIGLAEVLQLQGKRWHYTEESGLDTEHWYQGFVADDVEKIVPGAVGQTGTGFKSMSYSSLMPAFAEALREVDARLTKLETLGGER